MAEREWSVGIESCLGKHNFQNKNVHTQNFNTMKKIVKTFLLVPLLSSAVNEVRARFSQFRVYT
jgi:hypothetical protein